MKPLADLVRPTELDEVCGQEHILGKNKILDRIIKSGHISNMIFYGPPGTGKTTVANIIARILLTDVPFGNTYLAIDIFPFRFTRCCRN